MYRNVMSTVLLISLMSTRISCVEENSTTVEVLEEVPITSEDDSEQELSSQLHEVNTRSEGWSMWSEWSSCSRSCDGGVSHQLRRCQKGSCRGEHIRYKICNMQPCPESREFRDDQCAAFNSVPYEGNLYHWSAHYDDLNSCSLTCKGRPSSSSEESSEEPVLVIARLGKKVHDGTRCRPGSLDMCIDGRCQRVGCDLRIGSDKQVDACGVCGGDGSSCSRPLYHWTFASVSLCSVTCGGGYKMSRPVCQNRVSGEEVEEQLCNASQKPDSTVVECNTLNCPPRWHSSEWSQCSVSCGGGSRIRQVHCVEETNGTKIKVSEMKCSGHKPRFQEACNQMDCPKWHISQGSGCSVSCGEGIQVRIIDCRDYSDQPSVLCPPHTKPLTSKACSTGIQCPYTIEEHSDELLPGLYHTQPLIQPYPPPPPAVAEKLVGEREVPSESTFVPEEWGPCSVTCGEGVRKRQVFCKIFLEFSRTVAKLPDKQCSGPKPIETERCFMEPCSSERIDIKDDPFRSESNSNIKVAGGTPGSTYTWKEQGYTHCSATCLGGVQELIVNCVRDDTQKVTSPYMCPKELKPEILIRTCNDHPCPPRWNYSDFQPCTQSCGIGLQTREVNCIHEVTQGGGNTVVVPNNMCPQPPPPDRQYCNVLDCPVRWQLSEWSKCTKPCGGGEKTRTVECKQVMAQNHTVDRPSSMCPNPKPADKKPCNTKSCILESDKPHIDVSNTTYIQHNVKKKKVYLKIGGAATVFYGTVVKIKCPVKRYNRTKIQWAKDQNYLAKSKKFKTSKKGALRIQNVTYRDSGVYTCIAGKSSADLVLSVRPKPGEFMNSEEIQRQSGYKNEHLNGYDIAGIQPRTDDSNPILNNDDQSHEQRPDILKKPKTSPRTRLFTSTSPSLRIDSNVLNAWSPQSTLDSGQGQTFSSSRGHRMISFPEDVDAEDEENVVVLGKGSPENLKFQWIITSWSKCSQSCGNGIQVRSAHCTVRLHNNTEGVDDNLCEDAGIITPATVRKCGLDECPKWTTSEWSPCQKSKCFTLDTAMQRRTVRCQILNVTVSTSKCDPSEKPIHRQECMSKKCVGKWKVGQWSDCTALCDSQGVKYRILQCVWYGTKKPAGTACRDRQRPPVMKTCKGPPCPVSDEQCKDHSMFCSNVKLMNMCRIAKYQQMCCVTCAADE